MGDTRYYNPGHKMGQVGYGLHYSFVHAAFHRIEHKGKNNRQWKKEREIINSQHEGISEKLEESRIDKKISKILESYPGTVHYTQSRAVPFKGNNQSPHGNVTEQNEIYNSRKGKQV